MEAESEGCHVRGFSSSTELERDLERLVTALLVWVVVRQLWVVPNRIVDLRPSRDQSSVRRPRASSSGLDLADVLFEVVVFQGLELAYYVVRAFTPSLASKGKDLLD